MNWRLSELDRLNLVSNSDAHSLDSLGREANLLDIEPGFAPLRHALATGEGLLGTIEFYPEEGKYHLDGHRKCGIRLEPEETHRMGGRCPECGGPITVGVMSRVLELADRRAGFRPGGATPFQRLVPLAEVVAQVLGVGPRTKKVRSHIDRMLSELGPELTVLREVPIESIGPVGGSPVAEAIRRVRSGELEIAAGYDGEFGTVRIFAPGELDAQFGQVELFPLSRVAEKQPEIRQTTAAPDPTPEAAAVEPEAPAPQRTRDSRADLLAGLDPMQRRAAEADSGPLLIVAGPGTGKTHTLVARIADQVDRGKIPPHRVLAIAFTNQAAEELTERILRGVPGATEGAPFVTTFHGLGLALIAEFSGGRPKVLDDEQRFQLMRRAAGEESSERETRALLDRISLAKQSCDPWGVLSGEPELLTVIARYQDLLEERHSLDVDDLVLRAYQILTTDPNAASGAASRWSSICVDEYQDVNDVQAALIRLLSPGGSTLCAIGDPNQAIYGFRGARPGHFKRFEDDFPGTTVVRLETSYRLTDEILAVSRAVVADDGPLRAANPGAAVEIVSCPTPESEGEQIVVRLERIFGGTSYFAVDSGRGDEAEEADVGFGDVAVLCRTKTQRRQILDALGRSGIPCRRVGEDEAHDPRSQRVAVMTMHASKGREFEVVFVAGVEEGLVPLDRAGLSTDPEEEGRLLYVAMTRARRLLVLSHAARRTMWGQRLPGNPSPFLTGLPEDAIRRSSPTLPKRAAPSRQMRLF
jgi:DNA helicase-2/ATP-dependent DNA helicase PcrA